jgi:hypothetical protein
MSEWLIWVSEHRAALWGGLVLLWLPLLVIAARRERRRKAKKKAFGKELFADTADVDGYGLLREPSDAPE